jgi:3-phenylpropionate/trans-cinnamate dioxygenase ferredoxin component
MPDEPVLAGYVAAADLDDVREGYVTRVDVDGVPVVLTRTAEGGARAFDGMCTHAEFFFETSRLIRGCQIECPIHGARFSAVDGSVVKGPAKEPLEELPCRVEGGRVLVSVEAA